MPNNHFIDGALVQWRDRLFYPGNRIVRSQGVALSGSALYDRARAIRQRLHATVVRGAPQVMVKVTGGGRGMGAITAHFRYIGKHGRLPIEDDRGVVCDGKDGVQALVEQWRHAGALIPERSARREAFNVMLSMPAGRHVGVGRARGGPRLRAHSVREPPLRDGAPHASGEPARPPERARRRQGRPTVESAQGRLAPLARGLCREVARTRHRGRSLTADHTRRQPPHRAAVASQGQRRGTRRRIARRRASTGEAHAVAPRCDPGLVRDREGACVVGRRGRSPAQPVHRQLRALVARRSLQAAGATGAEGLPGMEHSRGTSRGPTRANVAKAPPQRATPEPDRGR